MDDIWVILAFFILISTCLFVWLRWQQKSLRFEKERMLMDAKSRADEYFLEGQKRLDELSKVKDELYDQKEQSLAHREALIGLQLQGIVEREANIKENATRLSEQEQQVIATQQEVNRMQTQWSERIAQIAGFTAQEARNALMSHIEKEAAADACKLSRRILDSAQSSAQEEAQRIIAIAIQRCAITHSFESDSAVIQLPSDDIKGRIIGREGRNIKTFENLTGITVMVDDSPGVVTLSGFDPIRREIAKRAMTALVANGQFNPSLIEEVVSQAESQVQESARIAAESAMKKAGLLTLLSEPVLDMLGKLSFRYSYSQNVLAHSVEVSLLAGLLAAELGMNIAQARRAGLLHDIGKAMSHENEGGHAQIGADFLQNNSESSAIVSAVANHHSNQTLVHDPYSALTCLISAADAISATRPGARLEAMQSYIKRFEQLEHLGNSIPAIQKCFALQAARELRVFVKPSLALDEQCKLIAKFIASKVQNELQFPGKIRVSVIRELRCDEFAE